MVLAYLLQFLCFFGLVNAHFRLNYPEPRGVFVADKEPTFCGGYTNAVSNRSTFPLSGGFFTIRTGHPDFTVGVLLSTAQNPNSFDNFTNSTGGQQFVRNYVKEPTAGTFCFPLDIAAANIPGVGDGANVTIQVVFAGGDGNLYQCADLTLSSTVKIPDNVTCVNQTETGGHSANGTSGGAPGATQTAGTMGRVHYASVYLTLSLGLAGMVLGFL
ncbi:hypothetical protein AMATHDRAFT_60588 [Amanita thiersii Skay4041]|uniref:Copper acquisition factor BIM1-like domain-containing protein n=1 Tax=Amanita thiersii Skay4041 TaxID=703135 RepID=A0A2A9NIC6_9AGAR|nr:hypothetical protein AMATHDRAFT_60588 [Amanita thiersii Skay4041]